MADREARLNRPAGRSITPGIPAQLIQLLLGQAVDASLDSRRTYCKQAVRRRLSSVRIPLGNVPGHGNGRSLDR